MATAEANVSIAAPPSKVWGLLGDVSTWESWQAQVKNGRMVDGEEFYPGSTFQYSLDGKPTVGTITLVERLKSLAWRAGNTRMAFRMDSDGETTNVSAVAEATGFIINLRKAKTEAELQAALQAWLNGLKTAAEKS